MKKTLLFLATVLTLSTVGINQANATILDYQQATQQSGTTVESNSGMVTVKYIDIADGHAIKSTNEFFGTVGQDLNITPPTVHSMDYVGVVGDPNGKYTTVPQTITFEYQRTPMKITISSFDEDDKSLGADNVLKFTGQNYDLFREDLLDRAGWIIDLDKTLYSEGNQYATLRQMMEMSNSTTAKELADFMNEKLRTDTIVDDTYDYQQVDVNIKVVYKKAPKTDGSVQINYLDENGNSIADSVTMTGLIGTDFAIDSKQIDGYALSKTQGQLSGQYTDQDQVVNLVYRSSLSNEVKPGNNADTSIQSDIVKEAVTSTQQHDNDKVKSFPRNSKANNNTITNTTSSESVLPDTGMNSGLFITLLGLGLLAIGSIIALKKEEI